MPRQVVRVVHLGSGEPAGGQTHARLLSDAVGVADSPSATHTPGGAITHGHQLTASNTGIPAGTSLTVDNTQPSGSNTDVHFQSPPAPGFWQVGSGASFVRCRFTGTTIVRGSNISFTDCEFVGNLSIANSQTVTLDGCHGHDGSDLVHVTADSPKGADLCSGISFTECLFDQPAAGPGDHLDGIQLHGIDGGTFTRCAFDLSPYQTVNGEHVLNAACFPDGDNSFGGHANLLWEDCFFNGGGYIIYLRAGPNGNAATDNNRFRNCYIGTDYGFGEIVNDAAPVEWDVYRYPAMTAVTL